MLTAYSNTGLRTSASYFSSSYAELVLDYVAIVRFKKCKCAPVLRHTMTNIHSVQSYTYVGGNLYRRPQCQTWRCWWIFAWPITQYLGIMPKRFCFLPSFFICVKTQCAVCFSLNFRAMSWATCLFPKKEEHLPALHNSNNLASWDSVLGKPRRVSKGVVL